MAASLEGMKRWDGLAWPGARQIGLLLHRWPAWGEGTENRGVILRPGGMGDLICAQMALEALELNPRQPLWLINRRAQPWAEVQRLRFFCMEEGMAGFLVRHRRAFGLVINTEQRFGLAHAFALALARKKIVAFASNRAVGPETETVAYDPWNEHEMLSHLRLFQAAYQLSPRAVLSPRKPQRGGRGKIVCVAGRQSPSRALPLKTWEKLITGWAAGEPFTLSGAPVDMEFTQELAQSTGATLFSGNFASLIEAISRAGEIFTIDSGMVHVASYYGVPTTAVFTSGREKKWAPLTPGSRLIRRSDLTCQPCTLYGQTPLCPHALACHLISWPEQVQKVVESV